jgi:hypothetical protein
MIDFKKKMEQDRIKKEKLVRDSEFVALGAAQYLLNLTEKHIPFSIPEQSEILVCQCCGHTWTSSEAVNIKKSWAKFVKEIRGPLCDICWLLYSVSNQAHVRSQSLKEAVRKFLEGRAKQTHRPFEVLWNEKR